MYKVEHYIGVEDKTKEQVLDAIKQVCLDARREDHDVVIIGMTPTVITLEERDRRR